jgi:ferrous iron transport protein B
VIAFKDYSAKIQTIKAREAQNQLAHSLAGRLGTAIEPLSHFAGFDWRDNIALIGGFAAKEVVVGTLGTAYSMGIVDPEDSGSLSSSLAADPSWSPLRAFALMVFVMLYAPCFVTIAAIKKETGSWKWAAFSTIYSTAFGFVIAVLIYQIGGLFN